MSEIHEKKETEEDQEFNPEIIEPKMDVLDAAIISRKETRKESRKVIDADTQEILDPTDFGKFIIEPIVSFFNGLIEKNPDLTAVSDKQIANLKRDFDKMVNSFGSDNPVIKYLHKMAKNRPYIPFLITLGGIGAQKGYELGKAKKERGDYSRNR